MLLEDVEGNVGVDTGKEPTFDYIYVLHRAHTLVYEYKMRLAVGREGRPNHGTLAVVEKQECS